jgi:DNA-binding FadR family transcriptional regulator
LLEFLEAIGSDLLGLIMQLIAFSEAIATRFPADAQFHLEILRHQSNSVRCQLMQLDSEMEQNLSESGMRRHLQSRGKKFFEDNSLIGVQL